MQDYWLPTPFASFPFTSPPVRRRVPSDSERAITLDGLFRVKLKTADCPHHSHLSPSLLLPVRHRMPSDSVSTLPLNGGWRKNPSDSSPTLALFTTERWDALRLRVEFSRICLNTGQCKLQAFSFYSASFQYSFLSFQVSSGHYYATLQNPSLVYMNFLITKTYEVVSLNSVPNVHEFWNDIYIYIYPYT